ncbi:sensor histidine kinase [Terrimonas alba]|uniref:sensor histidine kinase n=1 Tax=Terrimonas alba TaxID=3349636 RepID=UPI0035F4A3C6
MKRKIWYDIIFSEDRSSRWKRHFLFWLAAFVYQLIRVGIMYPPIDSYMLFFSLFGKALWWGIIANIIFTYSIVYLLIPNYFKKKRYFTFSALLAIILLAIFVINIALDELLNPLFRQSIGFSLGERIIIRPTAIRIFGNPPLICGLFLSLKTLKNWYLEQLKTETLAKENANAELQLLKAQVHPHFLFNTLNNIYSFSLSQSPLAGTLVKKLSGMLGYMINDCDEKLVPLEKELKLIEDYMGLEKVRYGKRLNMEVNIHGDFENKPIAPLLMIPFVENSFKHGTSQMLRHPWIKLEITCMANQLFFSLSNSKPSAVHSNKSSKGIGLNNVKKRLHLLYPGKHQLDIQSTDDTFIVNMQILLEEKLPVTENKLVQPEKAIAYAR